MSSSFTDSVYSVLSDTQNLPPEFVNYLIQNAILNRPALYQPGQEVTYSQATASVNVAASPSTTTVISGTPTTYTNNTVMVEFFAPQVTTPSNAAGDFINIGLFDGASQVVILGQVATPAAAVTKTPLLLRWRLTPTAGSHTYNIKGWANTTTGTPSVQAGTGTVSSGFPPAYLRITKV